MIPFRSPRIFFSICCCLILLSLSISSFSQQPSSYNLLWQISGKGLKKPSYLFGSMHTKDRRIFNFSDSVMTAMESCSAFVLEMHPDSLMKSYYVDAPSGKKSRDIKTVLSDKQIAELLKRYEERHGYLPDTAVLNNPLIIASLMKPKYDKADDMQTFVDAYLYGVARTLRKRIYGLEKMESQLALLADENDAAVSLFEDETNDQQEYLEEMTKLYIQGNIEEIWKFISRSKSDHLNLIERNKVMADGMIELFAKENLFVTVGAAHLPGNTGIIALLRKAGYTLRPVTATFTGIAKTYTIDYSKMEWQNYTDPINDYSISFPVMPVRSQTKKSIANLVYSSDISDGTVYNVTSYFTGPVQNSQHIDYLDTILQKYTEKQKVEFLSKKKILKNGTEGLEVDLKMKGKFVRTIIYLQNNTFYALSAENEKNILHEYRFDRFFDSFVMIKPTPVTATDWIDYKHTAGAFSVKIPTKPEEMDKEVPNPTYPDHPYEIKLFMSTDRVNMMNYLFRYNDYPTGMYLANLKEAFAAVNEQFIGKAKLIGEPRPISKDGMKGMAIDLVMQETYMEIQIYARGNRTYLLLRQNLNGPIKAKDDQFFDSFKIEAYAESKPFSFDLNNAKVVLPTAPSAIKGEDDETDNESVVTDTKSYYATNVNSGGLYGIESSTISKYARFKNVDSVYKLLLGELAAKTDSLIKMEDIMIGAIKGKFYSAKDTASGTQKRAKMWIDRDKYYFQTAIIGEEELQSKTYKDFIAQLSYEPSSSSYQIESSKAQLIMNDLRSTDSTVYGRAHGAFRYYNFEKDELPIIYEALTLSFPSDTDIYGARAQLINVLKDVNDPTIAPFLKGLFEKASADVIKAEILGIVPVIDSTNYDWYLKKLIENPPLKLKSQWVVFNPLIDSLAYVNAHFDQLLPLLDREEYRYNILDLASDMLNDEKKTAYLETITNGKDQLLKRALTDVDTYIADQKLTPKNVSPYLNILTHLKLEELTDEFTNKVFKIDSVPYLHTSALATRIKLKLKLDHQMLSAKMDSLDSRYEIMNAYRLAGRLNEVPLKYKKHEEFAKLLVYDYMMEDDTAPQNMKLLGKLTTDSGSYYIFEIPDEEDAGTKKYIALSGPFNDKKPTELEFDSYFVHMEWDELQENWLEQAKAIIATCKEEE